MEDASDDESEDAFEETEGGEATAEDTCAALRAGDIVALTAYNGLGFVGEFPYYLMRMVAPAPIVDADGATVAGAWPETLVQEERCDYGLRVEVGEEVVQGNLLDTSDVGAGVYTVDESCEVIARVEDLVLDLASQAPRRACLEDGEDGTMVLTSEEDARLKLLFE